MVGCERERMTTTNSVMNIKLDHVDASDSELTATF